MNNLGHQFPRSERLKSKKMITRLFDRNSRECFTVQAYPYRAIVYRDRESVGDYPEVLISVPKRNFKKAVLRNRIRRLTREAYRLQKLPLSHKTYIAFLYLGKEVPALPEVKKAVGIILEKIR